MSKYYYSIDQNFNYSMFRDGVCSKNFDREVAYYKDGVKLTETYVIVTVGISKVFSMRFLYNKMGTISQRQYTISAFDGNHMIEEENWLWALSQYVEDDIYQAVLKITR